MGMHFDPEHPHNKQAYREWLAKKEAEEKEARDRAANAVLERARTAGNS